MKRKSAQRGLVFLALSAAVLAGCQGPDAAGGASGEETAAATCTVDRTGDIGGVEFYVEAVGLPTPDNVDCGAAQKVADAAVACLETADVPSIDNPEARAKVAECLGKEWVGGVSVGAGTKGFGALFVSNASPETPAATCGMQYDPRVAGGFVESIFGHIFGSADPSGNAVKATVSAGALGAGLAARKRALDDLAAASDEDMGAAMEDVRQANELIGKIADANEITKDVVTDGKGVVDTVVDWVKGLVDTKDEAETEQADPPPDGGDSSSQNPDAIDDCLAAQGILAQCNVDKWATPHCELLRQQLNGCDSTIMLTDGEICPSNEPTAEEIEAGLARSSIHCWSQINPEDPDVNVCTMQIPGMSNQYLNTRCQSPDDAPTPENCEFSLVDPAKAEEIIFKEKNELTRAILRKAGLPVVTVVQPREPEPLPIGPGIK